MKKTFICAALCCPLVLFAQGKLEVLSGSLDFVNEAGKLAVFETDYSKTFVVEFGDNDVVERELGTLEQYRKENPNFSQQLAESDLQKYGMEMNDSMHNVMQEVMTKQMFTPNFGMFNKKNKKGLRFIADATTAQAVQQDEKGRKRLENFGYVFADEKDVTYKVSLTLDTLDMGNGGGTAARMLVGGLSKSATKAGGAIMVGTMIVNDVRTNTEVCRIKVNRVKGDAGASENIRLMNVYQEIFYNQLLKLAKAKK